MSYLKQIIFDIKTLNISSDQLLKYAQQINETVPGLGAGVSVAP